MLELLNIPGKEHALVVSNHKSDIDWLVGWVLAQVHNLSVAMLFLCAHPHANIFHMLMHGQTFDLIMCYKVTVLSSC